MKNKDTNELPEYEGGCLCNETTYIVRGVPSNPHLCSCTMCQKSSGFLEIKNSQIPLPGSFELLDELYHSGIPLYAITDNVNEIVNFLKGKYDFFSKFRGAAISAELGVLKPSKEIYHHLLKTYELAPEETIFFDDVLMNVEWARNVGMISYQFFDTDTCRKQLMGHSFFSN